MRGKRVLFAMVVASSLQPLAGSEGTRWEGALSTPRRIVDTALATPRGGLVEDGTNRSALIKLFLWRAEHYTHGPTPMLYNLPGYQPDPAGTALGRDNGGGPQMETDAMRSQFNYGWSVCGQNNSQLRPIFAELGWPHRCRPLHRDVSCETYVDGAWRQINADQYSLHFLEDSPHAHFASVDQNIAAPHRHLEWNPDLGLWDPGVGHYRLPQINTFGDYEDFLSPHTGRVVPNRSEQWRGWYSNVWDVESSGIRHAEEYTATPIVYRLRRGERFTRWLQPDGVVRDLGLAGRIWWGWNAPAPLDSGPAFLYSFVQNAPARDEVPGGSEESAGNSAYGNGCYDWTPDLGTDDYRDGAAEVKGAFAHGASPKLLATAASVLTLHHFSPYTIAARPLDRYDPANAAADGAVVEADPVGTVALRLSVNGGITWTSLPALTPARRRVDFTDRVKGRNQYLLRLVFNAGEGLDRLRLRTVTMMSQAVYPNLRANGTTVRYRAGHIGAIDLSPDLWTSQTVASTSGYVKKVAQSPNVEFLHYEGSPVAVKGTDGNPVSLTYKLKLPGALTAAGAVFRQVRAAMACGVAVPPRADSWGRIEYAVRAAGPWTSLADYTIPTDNEVSAYWVYGRTPDAASLGGNALFLRFSTHDPAWRSKIRFLRVYATYALPSAPAPLEVAYTWREGAVVRTATHVVPAGATEDAWAIDTGAAVAQDKVEFRVPGS